MMRLVDILYSLPFVFFVIMLVVFFGRSVALIFVAVGAVEWLDMARIVRAEAQAIRRRDYVRAAEALGSPPRRSCAGTWCRTCSGPSSPSRP